MIILTAVCVFEALIILVLILAFADLHREARWLRELMGMSVSDD